LHITYICISIALLIVAIGFHIFMCFAMYCYNLRVSPIISAVCGQTFKFPPSVSEFQARGPTYSYPWQVE